MKYDVVITIPNVEADSEEEAIQTAREREMHRGFSKATKIE